MYLKDADGFARTKDNPGALINVDNVSYEAYRKHREKIANNQTKIDQINTLEQSVNILNDEVSEIKNLLIQLLEKNK